MDGIEALDQLIQTHRVRRRGCSVCGAQTEAALSVMLRETISQRNSSQNPYRKSVSRQLSLCGTHAVAMWEQIMELLP